jgi:hypothetical protein
MKVELKQSDIDCGVKRDAEACPVYLAFKRANIPVELVYDDYATIVHDDGARLCILGRINFLPRLTAWIDAFDRGQPVEPCTINVEGAEAEIEPFLAFMAEWEGKIAQ